MIFKEVNSLPNIKSAKKRVKVTESKTMQNKMLKSALKTCMKKYEAAVWAQHGLFVSGPDFDTTFGLMHTIEKAADVYRRARQMNGGSDEFLNTISDEGLRQIGIDFGLTVNDEFLD